MSACAPRSARSIRRNAWDAGEIIAAGHPMHRLQGHALKTARRDIGFEFKDDLSRYRTGHGAKNMTIVAASLSASCVPIRPRGASRHDAKLPAGARISC
jgi:hypothetical protein